MNLGRYLDYCSEMLSLTGKIAALYVEEFDDSVVLASVNEVMMDRPDQASSLTAQTANA